jgi:hypothetical protein
VTSILDNPKIWPELASRTCCNSVNMAGRTAWLEREYTVLPRWCDRRIKFAEILFLALLSHPGREAALDSARAARVARLTGAQKVHVAGHTTTNMSNQQLFDVQGIPSKDD